MSDAETITIVVVGFFVLLALLVFLRLLFRKGPPHWNQFRIGVYLERVPNPEWEEWQETERLPGGKLFAPGDEPETKPFPPKP